MHDLPAIKQTIEDGRQALKAAGSPQWQDGHPTVGTIINDITHHQSWALIINDQLVGVATLQPGPEEDYHNLAGGAWYNDNDHYLTIHRVAINHQCRGQHLSSFLFSNLLTIGQEKGYTDFRIDTHSKNKVMQELIKKFGFRYRGTVEVADRLDPQRLAFELNLPTNGLPVEYHVDNNFMKPLVDKEK